MKAISKSYVALDDRADRTMGSIMEPFTEKIEDTESMSSLLDLVENSLPKSIGDHVIKRVNTLRVTEFSVVIQLAIDECRTRIIKEVVNRSFFIFNGAMKIYRYSREELVEWYGKNRDKYSRYFGEPIPEIITVSIGDKKIFIEPTRDMLIGILLALNSLDYPSASVLSSITEKAVNRDLPFIDLSYIQERDPDNNSKYQVSIITPSQNYATSIINFNSMKLMEGIELVIREYRIINHGEGRVWTNLVKVTDNGLIPLSYDD